MTDDVIYRGRAFKRSAVDAAMAMVTAQHVEYATQVKIASIEGLPGEVHKAIAMVFLSGDF